MTMLIDGDGDGDDDDDDDDGDVHDVLMIKMMMITLIIFKKNIMIIIMGQRW